MSFVDTNVLLDVMTADPIWQDWSAMQLEALATLGPLKINDIIYAELSGRFATIEALDEQVRQFRVVFAPIPRSALFLAGKVFKQYRRAGGPRTGVLADFFIGAHAAVSGVALLTRDPRRYRTYFPTLELICP